MGNGRLGIDAGRERERQQGRQKSGTGKETHTHRKSLAAGFTPANGLMAGYRRHGHSTVRAAYIRQTAAAPGTAARGQAVSTSPCGEVHSGEGSGWAVFRLDQAANAEAGRIPIDDAGHRDRFARQSAAYIRNRGADANAAALDAGALTRILIVIRFFAVLV